MVNVFSFCLYGPEKRKYYQGLRENIEIIESYFPSWKAYIYCAPDVTQQMLDWLKSHGCVVLRETHEFGAVNMVHRFFAIDEPDVDVMFSRDADSRIHWKDRWAIKQFMDSTHTVHVIRDNEMHDAYMMGGLWGMKKTAGISIRDKYDEFKKRPIEYGIGLDQNFLTDKIYPPVIDNLLAHYSFDNCFYEREHAVKFPFQWVNETYCGRVEGETWDLPPPKSTLFRSVPIRIGDVISRPYVDTTPAFVVRQPTENKSITNLLRRK